MKRHSVRLITAAVVLAGLAGCFSDPASSLRNGPAVIVLTRTDVFLATGDSVQVEARLQDEQGNNLVMSDVTWSTDNSAIADVHLAAKQEEMNVSSRAFIVAAGATGSTTKVRITSRGVADSIRVSIP